MVADIVLINGKIITIDSNFSITEALAISGDTILATGSDNQIRELTGKSTRIIDLKGKTVIPGLNDAHLHPDAAALSELDEEIPDVHNIEELLVWIKDKTITKEKGSWIVFRKFFSTRLEEMRLPTLAELDNAAPEHPVFLNGSFGGMINSCAMKVSGINKQSKEPGIIKDELTGLPTGFIRASAFALLKIPADREISKEEWIKAFTKMMMKYNQYGITSICAGTGDLKSVRMYREMADSNILTVRILQNILLKTDELITRESINQILNGYPEVTGAGDKWVKIGPLKVFLDGGILTGTAFMEEPWGEKASQVYNLKDPSYRGIINFSRDELLAIVSAANESGWSFTAHATGDGAVNLLLDVYKEVNKESSINGKRFSIIHGNFFSNEAIALMREMDIYANIQAAWFYKDADAMNLILGEEKMQIFHPNRSMLNAGIMLNGGSDHMVKLDANSSVNPYNPFLAMYSMITRKTEKGSVFIPEEAITREEALIIYTINNAFASFEESLKGSIEPGKLADLAILNKDILTCPADSIKEIVSLMTIVGGKIVYATEN